MIRYARASRLLFLNSSDSFLSVGRVHGENIESETEDLSGNGESLLNARSRPCSLFDDVINRYTVLVFSTR